MKTLTLAMLLSTFMLVSCATSITSTIKTVKQECYEAGAQAKMQVKNIDGVEMLKMTCTWDIPLDDF